MKKYGNLTLDVLMITLPLASPNAQTQDINYNDIQGILDYFSIPDTLEIESADSGKVRIIEDLKEFNTLDDSIKSELSKLENEFKENVAGVFYPDNHEYKSILIKVEHLLEETNIKHEWIHFIDTSTNEHYMIFYYYKKQQ